MNRTFGHFLLTRQASHSPSIILGKAFIFVVWTLSPCDCLPEIYFLGIPTGLPRCSEARAPHSHEDTPHLCAGSRASGVTGCCHMYFAHCLGHEDSHNTLWNQKSSLSTA
ncbi:hypothetical protein BDV34DRAFT_186349 [Aspergillus parasiticus]|uniref:Uncharacterized protein n=1 Tax=Aspergillus parasiticus TaxID=5067 RepID=A0A5N6DZP0_ASPPA|nr:hypothetical protein BDV34DRAFT_186349 [Aspergillus parasiticus]